MILVKDIEIEYVETEKDLKQKIFEVKNNPSVNYKSPIDNHKDPIDNHKDSIEIYEELVCGRRFTNARGETVAIGMRKQVQQAIGLPFEAFENMNKTTSRINQQMKKQRKELEKIKSLGFLKRLKFLLTSQI